MRDSIQLELFFSRNNSLINRLFPFQYDTGVRFMAAGEDIFFDFLSITDFIDNRHFFYFQFSSRDYTVRKGNKIHKLMG